MTNKLNTSFFCLCTFLLSACNNEQSSTQDFQQTQAALKALNSGFDTASNMQVKALPFTEEYLEKRHETLNQANVNEFEAAQEAELNYLVIQQRYPQRYLPWPATVDVSNQLSQSQKQQWHQFVFNRLKEAEESKIRLNRYELEALLRYVDEGTELGLYLSKYRARGRLGLYQLPNGKEWYQSKLNFYAGAAQEPQQFLSELQSINYNVGSVSVDLESQNRGLIQVLLEKHCDVYSGLNWQDGYINLPATAVQCDKQKLEQYKHLIITLAKVDLGVHFQAWSQKQALLELQNQLSISDVQAKLLLQNIVFYPATPFALAKIWL